jgi:hypothetical protein
LNHLSKIPTAGREPAAFEESSWCTQEDSNL